MLRDIVDVHCHVVENKQMLSKEIHELFEKFLTWGYQVPTPEFLIEQLDKAKVKYAVLQAYDLKEAGFDIPNEYVAGVLKQYPDRFICGYASANPIKRGVADAISMLEDAYGMGLRGLKLHPLAMQLFPNDKNLYPLYEKCIDYGIPVAFHIQPAMAPFVRLKYCNLVPIDELAHDLPDLKIQICHLGKYPMVPDVIDLMYCLVNNKNVYTDISCPMPLDMNGIRNTLNLIKQFNLVDKSMFGTDFPVMPQSWWVECIDKSDLTEEEKNKILFSNSLKFVGREDLLTKEKTLRMPYSGQ